MLDTFSSDALICSRNTCNRNPQLGRVAQRWLERSVFYRLACRSDSSRSGLPPCLSYSCNAFGDTAGLLQANIGAWAEGSAKPCFNARLYMKHPKRVNNRLQTLYNRLHMMTHCSVNSTPNDDRLCLLAVQLLSCQKA